MLILNPKDLNQYIEYNHFKMQGLQEILHLVTLLQKIAAYYISRMHYSISVDKSFQKQLTFYWKDKIYQFCFYQMVYHHAHAGLQSF